ncbi:MAG: hypothetical protein NZ954_00085 [Thermofilaceae archaeon]|nr:hypothetical protein [Thermofilaceae archaeon]MDW8003958.1 hypothetical protein [Thermofilaceae archaeon]
MRIASIITTVILIFALVPAAYAEPEVITKRALVLPEGSILFCGSVIVNGSNLPAFFSLDKQGRVHEAYYLDINFNGSFLDCAVGERGLVFSGYLEIKRRRVPIMVKVQEGDVKWSVLFQGDLMFAKSLAILEDGYAAVGPVYGAVDSDIGVVFVDEDGRLKEAQAFGSLVYDDFVERIYYKNGSLLLVGSTWSQNVSYSDILLAIVREGNVSILAFGGADRDEGFAALQQNTKNVVIGSSHSSRFGLSDAYFVVLVNSSILRVFSLGWPSYEGFVDVCIKGDDMYFLGYSTYKAKQKGVLLRIKGNEVKNSVFVEAEGDVVPLSLGFLNDSILTSVFLMGDTPFVLYLSSEDFKPLSSYTMESRHQFTVKVLQVDVRLNYCNLTDTWSVKRLSPSLRNLEIYSIKLPANLKPLNLILNKLEVESSVFTERDPPLKVISTFIGDNLPILVVLIPLLAIVASVVITKRRF